MIELFKLFYKMGLIIKTVLNSCEGIVVFMIHFIEHHFKFSMYDKGGEIDTDVFFKVSKKRGFGEMKCVTEFLYGDSGKILFNMRDDIKHVLLFKHENIFFIEVALQMNVKLGCDALTISNVERKI